MTHLTDSISSLEGVFVEFPLKEILGLEETLFGPTAIFFFVVGSGPTVFPGIPEGFPRPLNPYIPNP